MLDSFELNKVLGAVLGTCLALLTINITAGAIFAPHQPAKPGYEIAVTEQPAQTAGGGEKAGGGVEPIAKLLASADIAKGEAAAKKCAACHTFGKGEPNKVGPHLYGVVGRPKASVAGFNYSAAMKAKGGEWTFEELNHFLANPRGYIPGTAMTFAGVTRTSERADLIAFLNSHSDSPQPLPKEADAGAAAGGSQAGAQPAPGAQPAGAQPAPAANQPAGGQAAPAAPQPANSGAQPNAPQESAPKPQ